MVSHGRDELRDTEMAKRSENSKFELSFLHPKQSAIKFLTDIGSIWIGLCSDINKWF